VKKGVLTVRDNEHNVADTVGGNEVTCWKLPSLGNTRENPGSTDPVTRPCFSQGLWHHKSDFFFYFITVIFVFYSLIQTQ
jgi:hypothetical protein